MTIAGQEIHVSPAGSPYGDGSADYPVRGLARGLQILRSRRERGEYGTIWLHVGTHLLDAPLELTHLDSHTRIAAWPADLGGVRVQAAVRVTDWHDDSIDGTRVWRAPAPASVGLSLFADGRRVPKPRFPRDGLLRMADVPGLDVTADLVGTLFDGSERFTANPADIPALGDLSQTEVVVPHFWIQERFPIDSVDTATGEIRLGLRSILSLRDGDAEAFASYYFDGVPAGLGEAPGEWLFDMRGDLRTDALAEGTGQPTMYYVPLDGQRAAETEIVVPVADRFLIIAGTEADPVVDVRLEGIEFGYAEFTRRPAVHAPFQMREDPWLDPAVAYASEPQAASQVPGAIAISHARYVEIVDCEVSHVGGYAVRWDDGVRDSTIVGCTFRDLGAGALAAGGGTDPDSATFVTRNVFSDTVLAGGGRVYPHCAGILVRHASHIHIAHNDISDLYSTAISVGWRWDEGFSPSTFNTIEANYLHEIGQGRLDWFGAIYTLGVSPGTRIARNHITGVTARNFGGWGILLDPASAAIEVAGNVVEHTSHESLHIKSGRANIIAGNVFAAAGGGLISLAVPQWHRTATLLHNVFVVDDGPVFVGAPGAAPVEQIVADIVSDANRVVALTPAPLLAGNLQPGDDGAPVGDRSALWRAAGNDVVTRIIDSSREYGQKVETLVAASESGQPPMVDALATIRGAGPRHGRGRAGEIPTDIAEALSPKESAER